MLRFVAFTAARLISRPVIVQNVVKKPILQVNSTRNLTSLIPQNGTRRLLDNPQIKQIANNIITRNVIKYSLRKGKRKTVRVVLTKFYRLNWGIWIRTKCGREKKLWKKSPPRKRRLRQHVMCNATQSRLLDKMVGRFWMKPRYFVDDPYEPYHTREEFLNTYKKPKPYFPPEKDDVK